MQKDCHYYVTYIMARKAGFIHQDALHIAWAAQTVDEMEHDRITELVVREVYDENLARLDISEMKKQCYKKIDDAYNLTTFQSLGYLGKKIPKALFENKKAEQIIRYTWTPFHFLPISYDERSNQKKCYLDDSQINSCSAISENIEKVTDASSWNTPLVLFPLAALLFGSSGGIAALIGIGLLNQATEIINSDEHKEKVLDDRFFICHHTTQLCSDMIKDAAKKYEYAKQKLDDRLTSLYRIGISMHVLADTWSHENFCGSNNMFVNHAKIVAGGVPSGFKEPGPIGLGLVADGTAPLSSIWVGHGPVGTNPDIPGNEYTVERTYFGYKYSVKNRDRYKEAFKEMLSALKYINGIINTQSGPLENLLCEEKDNIMNPFVHPCTGMEYRNSREFSGLFIFDPQTDSENKRCEYMKNYVLTEYAGDFAQNSGDYDIYSSDENRMSFMIAAREHRDFVMNRIQYEDCKVFVDDYVKKELKEKIDDNIKDIINVYKAEKKEQERLIEQEEERREYKIKQQNGELNDWDEGCPINSDSEACINLWGGIYEACASGITKGRMFEQPVDYKTVVSTKKT